MKKKKNIIPAIILFIWCYFSFYISILMVLINSLRIIFVKIKPMLEEELAIPVFIQELDFLFGVGMIMAITGFIPLFRKAYLIFPWIYPYSMILLMDNAIFALAAIILEKGFSVINDLSHMPTIILMIIQIVVCRLAMCIYWYKFPILPKGTAKALITDDTSQNITNQDNETHSSEQILWDKDSFVKRIKKGTCFLIISCLIPYVLIAHFENSHKVNSEEAALVMEAQISSTLGIGSILSSSSEKTLPEKDFVISHSSQEDETKIWIWDYSSEDGDYIQILVNGTPLGDPFMISYIPIPYTVPATGEIKVLGIRDGGKGISYGIFFELNQTAYFNGTSEGSENLYILTRESLTRGMLPGIDPCGR